MATLERLQRWHRAHCDGTWEQAHGVALATCAGGGWSLRVDLGGTPLRGREFAAVHEQPEDADYQLRCHIEKHVWRGTCGSRRLPDLLTRFLDWAEHGEDAQT